MPLPLTDLDNRTYDDLVEEGRVLIPRYAPEWTDHNAHDPGITLTELLAWQAEQQIYRLNRVPERHRRKFLALLGFAPRRPAPARGAVRFMPASAAVPLPAGAALAAEGAFGSPRYRTVASLTVGAAALVSVQVFDGRQHQDRSGQWRDGEPVSALGDDPRAAEAPALLLGFDRPLPAATPLSLWLEIAGPTAQAPPHSSSQHHSARTAWEAYSGGDWLPLAAHDATRSLTLAGPVVLEPPAAIPLAAVGDEAEPRAWVRCRLAEGQLDAAPVLAALAAHAVGVEQHLPARSRFELPAGAPAPPPAGPQELGLELSVDEAGSVVAIKESTDPEAPRATVLASAAGAVLLTLVRVGTGTGLPDQVAEVTDEVAAHGEIALWSVAPGGGCARWRAVPDLDASGPADRVFVVAPGSGALRFGDGRRGAAPPPGDVLLAAWDATAGARATADPRARWTLAGADDGLNTMLLGGPVGPVAAQLPGIESVRLRPGADEEDVATAAGRAAGEVWAHERLVELAVSDARTTLDGLPRAQVLERLAPQRATTVLDLERLALDIPGAPVARARAWPGLDPALPCVRAAGTVTLVIVPWLPAAQAAPSAALVAKVRRALEQRRTIATRLIVTGPRYLEVDVRATVAPLARTADRDRLPTDVADAVTRFLHPLAGGADGLGWPFGRDLMVAELLALIDGVPGVDHVRGLELSTAGAPSRCGDLCFGPIALPALRRCDVTVA